METDNDEVNTQPTRDSQSQQDVSKPEPWGKLYGAEKLPVVELTEPLYTFGRDKSCSFEIMEEMLNHGSKYHLAISKHHFSLSWDSNLQHAIIQDYSSNGTYVNNERIKESPSYSKLRQDIIKSGSSISLAGKIEAFIFINLHEKEQRYDYPRDVLDKYTICEIIGRGASGLVHSVIEKGDIKRYALKVINKRNPESLVGMNSDASVKNEIMIMQSLKHPFVVKIKEVYDNPERCFLIMEYMGGGTLATKVKPGSTLTEPQAKFIFLQLLHAVKYLHSKGVVHRDLKPENILIHCLEDEPLLKVSDFGLSKFETDDPMTFCGSQLYVAPEVILGKNSKMYTSQVDIWSLGVILYLTLIGDHPFKPGPSNMSLHEQIKNGRYDKKCSKWKSLSKEAKAVIESMLMVHPNKRATIKQLEASNWLKDHEIKRKVNNRMSGEQNFASPPLKIFSEEEPEPKKPRVDLETPTTSTEEATLVPINRASDETRESTNMLRTLSFSTN